MRIRPLTGALGAEIKDVDLANLTEQTHEQIEAAFHQHLVLVFPDQSLTTPDLLALTHQLGGPGETPYLQGLSDFPDVVPIIKAASEKKPHQLRIRLAHRFYVSERATEPHAAVCLGDTAPRRRHPLHQPLSRL